MNRQEFLKNFINRMEQERNRRKLTQAQMAQLLGISTSGYKKIISGETTRIDLFTGYNFYRLSDNPIFESQDNLNPAFAFSKKYKSLSPSQKHFLDGILDFELAFQKEHSNTEDYITLFEPTGNLQDGMLWDSANVSKLEVSAYRKQLGGALDCGIKITSNHLSPAYYAGDILLITQQPPRDGDTGIFLHTETGRVYIRRFRQTKPCRLEPVNGYGKTFYVDSENPDSMKKWIKFGYVLTKIR